MSGTFLYANNAHTTLAGPIAAGATSLNLAAGSGSLFPAVTTGQQFSLTLTSQLDASTIEIVYCTGRSGDVCTVIRGREGTAPTAFIAGDSVDNFFTAGTAAALIQAPQLQQQAGNYAIDAGVANAYVINRTPTPGSLALTTGAPIRVLIKTTNTGSSTLTDSGLPSTLILNPNGTVLNAGQLLAGQVAEFYYTGTAYQLASGIVNTAFQNIGSFGPAGSLGNTGTTIWVVPAGTFRVHYRLWGAGGGGGGSAGPPSAASGGGAGGYAEGIYPVTPGQAITVVAGANGQPGAAATPNGGSAGGQSSFGTVYATGGGAGNGAIVGGYQTVAGAAGIPFGGNILNIAGVAGSAGANTGGSFGFGGAGGNGYSAPGSPGTFGTSVIASPVAGGGAGGANGGAGGEGGAGIVIIEY